MIFISVLSGFVLFTACFGRVPTVPLAALSALSAALLAAASHRRDGESLATIDQISVNSRLSGVNPALKMIFFCGALLAAVASRSALFDLAAALMMALIVLLSGRVRLQKYLRLLLVPVAFLLVSVLAVLFDWSRGAAGVLNLPVFGGFLIVTKASQLDALRLIAKVLAGICCLYALSLTTPLYDIVSVLRAVRLPEVVIELMFLIYRYIFVLGELMSTMKTAAASRFGFRGHRAAMRTAGGIMTSLLALSFRRASTAFDAMESRCYDGHLRFLSPVKPLRARDLTAACLGAALLALVWAAERSFL